MDLPLALIIIGLVLALLVSTTLGALLIVLGIILLVVPYRRR
jgi:hypothetical protein